MPIVRELRTGDTALAHATLLELRADFASLERFTRQIDEIQRAEGYRLVGSFDELATDAVAVAGFRIGHNLAWGHYVYVDDLVTRAAYRGRGHADALMRWLFEEAGRLGCDQLHLDSGTHRHDAHRFYFKHDLSISSFHFGSANLKGDTS